jgi:hypothetical protein
MARAGWLPPLRLLTMLLAAAALVSSASDMSLSTDALAGGNPPPASSLLDLVAQPGCSSGESPHLLAGVDCSVSGTIQGGTIQGPGATLSFAFTTPGAGTYDALFTLRVLGGRGFMTFSNAISSSENYHSLETSETAFSFETFLSVPAQHLDGENRLMLSFRGSGRMQYTLQVLTPSRGVKLGLGEAAALAAVYSQCCPVDGDSTLWGDSSFCTR